ncbi:MAG: hypothetical protein HC903_18460 [Methylacidiphilales bacterium]|nr:hypothetical protein [Candidatus Methylacidiphilales bacterium]NJR14349.1 hypothetical protein [Calothrix sp. CSU_2_0]
MTNIRKLLNELANQENQLPQTQFIAPCLNGGKVRTKMSGMIYTFTPKPRNFEGWGIFQPVDMQTAEIVDEASLPQIGEYLKHLQPLKLRLAHVLQRQTWLAYPVNEADMQQRYGVCKPLAINLVSDGTRFDVIVARTDGMTWWFDECDRGSDPFVVQKLQANIKKAILPKQLHFKGITPEMRTVYDLVAQKAQEFDGLHQQKRDENRLREALKLGGGELHEFRDRKDHWVIEWITGDGEHHNSAISKSDLTVISAGICLSGEDKKFDLQSLVTVVEQRDND